MNIDEHKYLTYGIQIELLIGAAFATASCVLFNQSIGIWVVGGASLGMMLGVVVGSTIDSEIKRKIGDE